MRASLLVISHSLTFCCHFSRAISEELPDVSFHYSLATLCATANQRTIPMTDFKSAVINAGYRISNFHKDPLAIKTDAPNGVLWDIIRAYSIQYVAI